MGSKRYIVPNLNKAAQGDGTDLNVSDCETDTGDKAYTTFSGASPSGFSVTSDGSDNHYAGTADEITIVSGNKYIVRFNMSLNSGAAPSVRLTNSLLSGSLSNNYSAINGYNIMIFVATGSATGIVRFRNDNTTTDYSISNLSVQNLAVEPTQEILNVNAFSGVARNVLSGDLVSDPKYRYTYGDTYVPTNCVAVDDATEQAIKATASAGSARLAFNTAWYESGKTYEVRVLMKSDQTTEYPDLYNGSAYIANDNAEVYNGEYKWFIWSNFSVTTNVGLLRFSSSSDNGDIYYVKDVVSTEIIPEVTNTDVEVVREGSVHVPRFNGSSSNIDCGSYNDLIGDITLLGWIECDVELTSYERLIDNGQLSVQYRHSSGVKDYTLYIVNNGSNPIYPADNVLKSNELINIAIVRKADGKTTWYINGELSGSEDQAGNTPVAGTTNVFIGKRSTGNYWKGHIPEVKVIEGLLTAEEISQYFSATKMKYGK